MSRCELLMVYEPEEACRTRLTAGGYAAEHVLEMVSYLAQSSHLALMFEEIAEACARRDLSFRPVALDDAARALVEAEPARTLVWTLTDGIAYFRGGAAPALARLRGLATFGSDDSAFALCQDKFRSGAVLRALGLPAPPAGLARDGEWLTHPPHSTSGFFIKPNRLGSKIGIWEESHCSSLEQASALSRRIFAAYRDDAVVQPYLPGRNVRASFLAVAPSAGPEALGAYFVDSGGDFQTMAENMSLYCGAGGTTEPHGRRAEPRLTPVLEVQPQADCAIRATARTMMTGLGLRDVFSIDLRVEESGTVHLIEFEVCPGLPGFDFRSYCRARWDMDLADSIAAAAAARVSSWLHNRRLT